MIKVFGVYGGVGGLVGASMAGCRIVAAEEPREEFNHLTFYRNKKYFGEVEFTRSFTVLDIEDIIRENNGIDIMISSPPCKRFSALGSRKKNQLTDVDWTQVEMSHVFKRLLSINPEFAIIENLPKASEFISFERDAEASFNIRDNRIVYNVPYFIYQIQLQANQYGVPQRRLRHFWILSRQQFKDYLPPNPPDHGVPCGRFLREVKGLPNMDMPKHSRERIEGFKKLKPGDSYYETANNRRQDPNKLADVITSHRTQHVHPYEPRTFTVRESARLMGYPDDFIFYGPRTGQLDQVGMAICPPITRHIIESYFNFIGY